MVLLASHFKILNCPKKGGGVRFDPFQKFCGLVEILKEIGCIIYPPKQFKLGGGSDPNPNFFSVKPMSTKSQLDCISSLSSISLGSSHPPWLRWRMGWKWNWLQMKFKVCILINYQLHATKPSRIALFIIIVVMIK